MPLYTLTHTAPLSAKQQQSLATALTNLHTGLFTTPSLFVNVRFVPTPAKVLSETSPRVVTFVGGKERTGNYLEAQVRNGGGRGREMFMELAEKMTKIWAENVPEDENIRVFVYGGIIAGYEYGFPIPEAGKDGEWMKEHFDAFKERAEKGDEVMKDLVEEIGERKLI